MAVVNTRDSWRSWGPGRCQSNFICHPLTVLINCITPQISSFWTSFSNSWEYLFSPRLLQILHETLNFVIICALLLLSHVFRGFKPYFLFNSSCAQKVLVIAFLLWVENKLLGISLHLAFDFQDLNSKPYGNYHWLSNANLLPFLCQGSALICIQVQRLSFLSPELKKENHMGDEEWRCGGDSHMLSWRLNEEGANECLSIYKVQ